MIVQSTISGKIGINRVRAIVEEKWWSKWQSVSAENDDGLDGLVFLCKRQTRIVNRKAGPARESFSIETGVVAFVQVKSGPSYLSSEDATRLRIRLGTENIQSHRRDWRQHPGPTILVYVDAATNPKRPAAWWVDLRSPTAFPADAPSLIDIPKDQVFGEHTKGHLLRLSQANAYDARLPVLRAVRSDGDHFRLSASVKSSARAFYRAWSARPPLERTHAVLGEIEVTRVGWRHITRKGRAGARIHTSLSHLPLAARMIREVPNHSRLGHVQKLTLTDGATDVRDYLGLRARVEYPDRCPAVIQVVLKRKRVFAPDGTLRLQHVWLLSVYEVYRRCD